MSSSAAAHDGSRSNERVHRDPQLHRRLLPQSLHQVTRERVERRVAESMGRAGDVDHEVGAPLELVDHAQGHEHEAEVGVGELAVPEDPQALVLDGVAQRVDGVVVADDGVGLHGVVPGDRRGRPDHGVDRERGEVHDLDA